MTSSKLITVEWMATKKAAEPPAKKVKKDDIAPFESGCGWTGTSFKQFHSTYDTITSDLHDVLPDEYWQEQEFPADKGMSCFYCLS